MKLPYDSAIEYVYKKIEGDENVAMVGAVPVSWSQLRSQDPALNELEEKYNSSAVAFVYAFALMTLEQKNSQDAKVSVEYFSEKPTVELKKILQSSGLEASDAIEFKFSPGASESLAKVEEKTLTHAEFIKSNLSHAKLYKKVFNQRMQRLNGIVIRRFILQASKDEKN